MGSLISIHIAKSFWSKTSSKLFPAAPRMVYMASTEYISLYLLGVNPPVAPLKTFSAVSIRDFTAALLENISVGDIFKTYYR